MANFKGTLAWFEKGETISVQAKTYFFGHTERFLRSGLGLAGPSIFISHCRCLSRFTYGEPFGSVGTSLSVQILQIDILLDYKYIVGKFPQHLKEKIF